MNTTKFGSLGEAKVITKLMELGFDIFTPAFDRSVGFDLIAHNHNKLYRIQVKSTSTMDGSSYVVRLRSCRPNNSVINIKKFNPESCEIVAIYIHPLNTICFISSEDLNKGLTTINMRKAPTKHANGRNQWIINDYLQFPL